MIKLNFSLILCSIFIANQAYNADLVIFSCDRPLQLYAFLESLYNQVSHLDQVHVIVRSTHSDYKKGYEEVFKLYPQLVVKEQTGPHDFKSTLLQSLHELSSEYILFAVDDIVVTDSIDLDYCIRMMQSFDAYGFYLRLGKNCTLGYPNPHIIPLPQFVYDAEGLCLWQFSQGSCDWAYPHTVDMTIYKKDDVLSDFTTLEYMAPNTLESSWAWQSGYKMDRFGLCFEHSCMVNIPMNRVQNEICNHHMGIVPRELLDIFYQGKKIDIQHFHKIDNSNSHMDAWPVFVAR